MGSLTLRETNLNDLHNRVRDLISDATALAGIFAGEADRLNRNNMVSQLTSLRSSISRQVHEIKTQENDARRINIKTGIAFLGSRLVTGFALKKYSPEGTFPSVLGDQLLKKPAAKQCSFGTIMIRIGPTGVPDGVGVVSVSQFARESNREETAVSNELREGGCRLFSENSFSLLIEKLIEDVQEGRLLLPVSPDKLPQLKYTVAYRPDGKVAECLPLWSSFNEGGQVSP